MRHTLYILTFFTLIACSSKTEKHDADLQIADTLIIHQQPKVDTLEINEIINKHLDTCVFIYDTITDEKYEGHLFILNVLHNKEPRDHLYYQDVAMFTMTIDPCESGLHWHLTNKVIFALLEKGTAYLDLGLTQWPAKDKQYDYFFEHISNPKCNTLSIDQIIEIIQKDMKEPHENAKKMKKAILERLEQSKY